jgi:YggT family protein
MKSLFLLIDSCINIYIWIIIINAVLSWLVAFNVVNAQNRFVFTVLNTTYQLTDPVLNKIRKFIPNLGSIDISPVVLILLLIFIRNLFFELLAPRLF